MRQTVFERYPKTTLWILMMFLFLGALWFCEFIAGHFFGLGKTVVYQAHPLYGYRPFPNQDIVRAKHHIKINNLGLRADEDWDNNPKHKILFLGDSVTYGGSYIDNPALFSHIAVQHLPGYMSGNAGVNGWGVDNVVAFIKDQHFLPADIYVCTFPEGDFYRGMTRIGGQPFWNRQPHFALEELLQYFVYQIHLKKFPLLHAYQGSEVEKTHIAEAAVRHLKELSEYLHAHDKILYIYISPSLPQVLGEQKIDPIIKQLFDQYQLRVTYLIDKLPPMNPNQKTVLYHDVIHLSESGHQLWGRMMADDLQNMQKLAQR